jgi:short-subunit dehydrogenase involved in D-alanine esterification of teichoic acids
MIDPMKTVVITGGTAGFGAVAAKRISNTPNTKLILGHATTRIRPVCIGGNTFHESYILQSA